MSEVGDLMAEHVNNDPPDRRRADEMVLVRRGDLESWLSNISALNRLAANESGYGPSTEAGKHREIIEFFAGDGEEELPSGVIWQGQLRTVLNGAR